MRSVVLATCLLAGCLPPPPSDKGGDPAVDTDRDTTADTDTCMDCDDDGYTTDDCDDGDPAVNPGAAEVCNNGVDDDCDGAAPGCRLSGDYTSADLSGSPDSVASMFGESGENLGQFGMLNGDIDADGYDDLVIAARTYATDAGAIYVIAGRADLLGCPSAVATCAAWSIVGDAGDSLGILARAADLDGDGVDDLAVGAALADLADGTSDAGAVYLFYGAPGLLDRPIDHVSVSDLPPSATFTGSNASDQLYLPAIPGDLMGSDGLADLAIAAPYGDGGGSLYLFQGTKTRWATSEGASLDAEARASAVVRAQGGDDAFGPPGGSQSDLDGDGALDLTTYAQYADGGAGRYTGAIYVMFGPVAAGEHAVGDLIDSGDALRVEGEGSLDYLVGGSADLDGDGSADLLGRSGRHDAGESQADSGRIYVWYGPIGRAGVTTATPDAWLDGESAGDGLGSITVLGDLDADGETDFAVGATSYPTALEQGRVYLYYGTGDRRLGVISLADADATFTGSSPGDLLGARAAGDFNGDGRDDLVLGAPGYSEGDGAAWLVYGRGM